MKRIGRRKKKPRKDRFFVRWHIHKYSLKYVEKKKRKIFRPNKSVKSNWKRRVKFKVPHFNYLLVVYLLYIFLYKIVFGEEIWAGDFICFWHELYGKINGIDSDGWCDRVFSFWCNKTLSYQIMMKYASKLSADNIIYLFIYLYTNRSIDYYRACTSINFIEQNMYT